MRRTHLDHATTTSARPDVVQTMLPYCAEAFGNLSSIYSCGQEAKAVVEQARVKVESVSPRCEESVFTCGGTEADDCAPKSLISHRRNTRKSCSVFKLCAPLPCYFTGCTSYVKDCLAHQLLTSCFE